MVMSFRILILGVIIICLRTITLGQDSVYTESAIVSVDWNYDGTKVALGYEHGLVEIMEISTSQITHTFQYGRTVQQLRWSPVTNQLAIVGVDSSQGYVKVVDDVTGQIVFSQVEGEQIRSVTWSSDGTKLAAMVGYIADDFNARYIHIWNTVAWTESSKIYTGYDDVLSIDWEPNGNLIATGDVNSLVTIWDTETGTSQSTLSGHVNTPVETVSFSPDGSQLASGDFAGEETIQIWNTLTGENILTFLNSRSSEIDWHPNGTVLASAAANGGVQIWDVESGILLNTLSYSSLTETVRWNPSGTMLAVGGSDSTFSIIQLPSANAGTDQNITTLNSTALVILDGSGSSADGSIVSYVWTDSTGAQVATGVSPMVDLPVGVHTLTLTVTDDDGATASDAVVITVVGD